MSFDPMLTEIEIETMYVSKDMSDKRLYPSFAGYPAFDALIIYS